MSTKKFFLSWLVVFTFFFLYEMVFHGKVMEGYYHQTAHLWRTEGEMQRLMPLLTLSQFLFAGVFAFIFRKGYEGKGLGEGIRYGFLIGLLFAPKSLVMYAVAPYPLALPLGWAIGEWIEYIVAGTLLGLIYRKPTADHCACAQK